MTKTKRKKETWSHPHKLPAGMWYYVNKGSVDIFPDSMPMVRLTYSKLKKMLYQVESLRK